MKLPHLLPAFLFIASALHANHGTITDVGGSVAPLTVRATLSESVGGHRLGSEQLANQEARGATFPELVTYDTTYQPDAPAPAVLNPFGWDDSGANHYLERVTTDARDPQAPVVTANGFYRVFSSRYTNATLLEDLVATGKIPSAVAYSIVAVRFDLDHEVHYTTTTQAENHTTHVNDHYYFFAENGPDDPAPVFLGAVYNDIYLYQQTIGLTRTTTIQSGRYVDTFTGDPVEGGFDYALAGQNFRFLSAGDFLFVRPAPGEGNSYRIHLGGNMSWTETYHRRSDELRTGALIATSLEGPAQGYFGADGNDDGHLDTFTPNGGDQAIAAGSVRFGPATHHESMLRYLNQLPPVMPH